MLLSTSRRITRVVANRGRQFVMRIDLQISRSDHRPPSISSDSFWRNASGIRPARCRALFGGCPTRTRRLRAEPALAFRVGANRPQEVDPPEVRPVRLTEEQFGVGGLP